MVTQSGQETETSADVDLAPWLGRRVRVKKGVEVRNNHPHAPAGWHPAGRSQTVLVSDAYLEGGCVVLSWLGSGRYWKDVRAEDVKALGLSALGAS